MMLPVALMLLLFVVVLAPVTIGFGRMADKGDCYYMSMALAMAGS